jgi:hypothetical protein
VVSGLAGWWWTDDKMMRLGLLQPGLAELQDQGGRVVNMQRKLASKVVDVLLVIAHVVRLSY